MIDQHPNCDSESDDVSSRSPRITLKSATIGLAVIALLILFNEALHHGRVRSAQRERGARTYMVSMLLRESFRNNQGVYPLWDPRPGHLFYDRSAMNPSFQLTHPLNRPPATPQSALLVGDINNQMGFLLDEFPDEEQYLYLPYAVSSEAEGLALLDAYRRIIHKSGTFADRLEADPGTGTCGGDCFYRIRHDLQKILNEDSVTIPKGLSLMQDVPVIFERPDKSQGGGGWVVPMNRQPVWVPYPGPFPMTERFINAIEELEAEFRDTASSDTARVDRNRSITILTAVTTVTTQTDR